MALIKCPECGQSISGEAQVCIHCGYPIARDKEPSTVVNTELIRDSKAQRTVYCPKCDGPNPHTNEKCRFCGAPLKRGKHEIAEKRLANKDDESTPVPNEKRTGCLVILLLVAAFSLLGTCGGGSSYDAYDLRDAQERYYSGSYTREDERMVEGFNRWKADQDKYID